MSRLDTVLSWSRNQVTNPVRAEHNHYLVVTLFTVLGIVVWELP